MSKFSQDLKFVGLRIDCFAAFGRDADVPEQASDPAEADKDQKRGDDNSQNEVQVDNRYVTVLGMDDGKGNAGRQEDKPAQ